MRRSEDDSLEDHLRIERAERRGCVMASEFA
jgi:hypothetical protein